MRFSYSTKLKLDIRQHGIPPNQSFNCNQKITPKAGRAENFFQNFHPFFAIKRILQSLLASKSRKLRNFILKLHCLDEYLHFVKFPPKYSEREYPYEHLILLFLKLHGNITSQSPSPKKIIIKEIEKKPTQQQKRRGKSSNCIQRSFFGSKQIFEQLWKKKNIYLSSLGKRKTYIGALTATHSPPPLS